MKASWNTVIRSINQQEEMRFLVQSMKILSILKNVKIKEPTIDFVFIQWCLSLKLFLQNLHKHGKCKYNKELQPLYSWHPKLRQIANG